MTLILSGTDGLSDIDGSAATPAIRGTDTNTGIFFPAADTIAFSEGGTEAMRIDSSGNVGVGVTPSAWEAATAIQVANGYAYTKYGMSRNTYYDGTNYRYITTAAAANYQQSSGAHVWQTAASGTAGNTVSFTEAMRIDSSGNVGIGTSSPRDVAGYVSLGLNDTTGSLLDFYANGTRIGGVVGVSGNMQVGTATAIPLIFNTDTNERARITSSGDLLINTVSSSAVLTVVGRSGSSPCSVTVNANGDSAITIRNSSGTTVGTIVANASTTAYNTSSDYRLKHDIAPMTGALAKVAALKPVTYKWNADNSAGEGFIAHELAEVVPQCVTGEKDAVETYTDEEGNEQTRPKYQGIDTSFLVATLTAAIQEQQAIIQSLTARIEALEGK